MVLRQTEGCVGAGSCTTRAVDDTAVCADTERLMAEEGSVGSDRQNARSVEKEGVITAASVDTEP